MNNASQISIPVPARSTLASFVVAKAPALAVLAFGIVTLYCVGFATASVAHNAAHDTRHANGFPCH